MLVSLRTVFGRLRLRVGVAIPSLNSAQLFVMLQPRRHVALQYWQGEYVVHFPMSDGSVAMNMVGCLVSCVVNQTSESHY